jgi:hypothetical protein
MPDAEYLGDPMSATTLIDTAPFGALIRYGHAGPKPPARFRRKLAAWEDSNGLGRLIAKGSSAPTKALSGADWFTLHEGFFSTDGIDVTQILHRHTADSPLSFRVVEVPKPGQVRVLIDLWHRTELLYLARSVSLARQWLAKTGYCSARLELVRDDPSIRCPENRPGR